MSGERLVVCDECRYWLQPYPKMGVPDGPEPRGECHRHAPLARESKVAEEARGYWPSTYPFDQCGEGAELGEGGE